MERFWSRWKSNDPQFTGQEKTRLPFPSVSCRHSVLARFAGADVNALAIVHFDFDRLITAVAADVETHVVSFLAQLAHGFVRNAAFDFDVAAVLHFFTGRFAIPFVMPARC